MRRILSSFSCLLLLVAPMLAQVPTNYVTKQTTLPCINETFELRVHIINNEAGVPDFDQAAFESMVEVANDAFAPICAKFIVCDYLSIENYRYSLINSRDSLELADLYGSGSKIDVFIPNEQFIDSLGFEHCGDATFAGVLDLKGSFIGVVNECITTDGKELTQQLGRYFGLYPTYYQGIDVELVERTNCEVAGDLICDTPADPYERPRDGSYTSSLNPCLFTFSERDADGNYYVPHVANAMSEYDEICNAGFTLGQLQRVLTYYRQASVKPQ